MSLAASGCGEVESGICPGEQDDMVECTVDLCDPGAGAWAHIPNDGLCEAGQRCDPTGGCVAAGGLTGRATLFGHADHAGITVSVDGIEGASTMTDAMGNWSLGGLPTGTYAITYTKDKYVTAQQPGVGVLPSAATSPPEVELVHGNTLGIDQNVNFNIVGDSYNGTFYSPDKKHVVVRYNNYYSGTVYRAYKLDALQSAPVPMFVDTYPYNPQIPFWVTNTHIVWTVGSQTVWSRPLDGGPPSILGSVAQGESLTVVGTPNAYVVLRRQRTTTFVEHSLYVVRADGTVPMGTSVWVTPDAQHTYGNLVNNDTTALLFLNNSTASPPTDGAANIPLRRIDLATGAVTNVNTGFATNESALWSVSPDGNQVFGYLRQAAPNNWYRSFLIPIAGTAGPKLAPDYGAAVTQFSDYPGGGHTWFADSSGVVFASTNYGPEGQLKVWHVTSNTSTVLVAYNTYFNWTVHNKVVIYRDSTANTAQMKVVSAHSTAPVIYNLDVDGVIVQDLRFDDSSPTSSYMVWTQSVSSGSGVRARIKGVTMAQPLVAAPTVTQLGGTLATTCAFEGTLSGTTYWQLCQDTGVLSGFTASTATAGTTTQGVRAGLIPLPEAGRIGFRKNDGKLYSSPNTGTLSDVKLVSAHWDGVSRLKSAGNWVFFGDINGDYLRASNADGSGIDEPLAACRFQVLSYNSEFGPVRMDTEKTHILLNQVLCGDDYGEFVVPTANLP